MPADEIVAVAASAIAVYLGRARICSSNDGLSFSLNLARSWLLTVDVPTTTIFELRFMVYATPSGSTVPVLDTAFFGAMVLVDGLVRKSFSTKRNGQEVDTSSFLKGPAGGGPPKAIAVEFGDVSISVA